MTRHRTPSRLRGRGSVSPGVRHVVAGPVAATPGVRRRLAELGVREGALVMLRTRTSGGGAILAVGDTRIAVSCRLLASIPMTPEPDAAPGDTGDAAESAS